MHEAHNRAPEDAPLAISPRRFISPRRRAAELLVLSVCALLLLRQWGVEPYQVPTGSMAPALAGHHRLRTCPRCGHPVRVGRHHADNGAGPAPYRLYRGAHCPNCGQAGLDMHTAPQVFGDRLLVNRSVYAVRAPSRWEMVVFRLLGITFVKRIIGLPGEVIEIRDGDIYVNGQLQRKGLDDFRAVCIPVFDNDYQPAPGGWRQRWQVCDDYSGPHPLRGTELHLDGVGRDRAQVIAYRHHQLDSAQCEAIADEYAYNGPERARRIPVHDFLMKCGLEVSGGEGNVLLGITDGHDRLVAEIPAGTGRVGQTAEAKLHGVKSWPLRPGEGLWPDREIFQSAAAQRVHLEVGRRYQIELAFVDRRFFLAIDGTVVLGPLDLPAVRNRPGVVRPVVLGARGVRTVVRNFRLFRDIHYTGAGPNAAPGKAVHLEADQYFVLGDNSPNSQDSRFWPNGGAVPACNLVGKPFLIHLPSRAVGGDAREVRGMDWGRVRWIH